MGIKNLFSICIYTYMYIQYMYYIDISLSQANTDLLNVYKGSDFSALSSFRRWYFPKTFATDMNSKFFPRFLLLFSLIAFCLPAPKFLLLETENNGEDAGGEEAEEQTRDETWPQVDFDFILNYFFMSLCGFCT